MKSSLSISEPPLGEYVPMRWRERVESTFALSLDLGQANDYSALSLLERRVRLVPDAGRRGHPHRRAETEYLLRGMKRFPLGTSYVDQAAYVEQRMAGPDLRGAALLLDLTGVGRAVGDLFRRIGLRPIGVTITGGTESSRHGIDWHVSKLELISALQARVHDGSLKVTSAIPDARILANELADFRVNFTGAGAMTFGARSGRHDDLVLSLAIAVWYLSKAGGEMRRARVVGI